MSGTNLREEPKIIIIKGSEGVSIQTYDRGKMQHNQKLPDATLDDVLKRLPLDFVEISVKDGPYEKKNRQPKPRERRYRTESAAKKS